MNRKKISAKNAEELACIANFLDENWTMLQRIRLQELLFKESAEGKHVRLQIDFVEGLRSEHEESNGHENVYWHLKTPKKLNFYGTQHRQMSDRLATNFLVTLRKKLFPVISEMRKRQREEDEKSAINSVIEKIATGKARNYNFS